MNDEITELKTRFMEMDIFFAVSAVSYFTNAFYNVRNEGKF